jgi:A/G-specific adenine glycosylase
VPDADIYPYLEKTLPPQRAREWYSALMDYGTHLKKTIGNPNQRSRHYSRQSTFTGSDREIRGAILKALTGSNLSILKLKQQLSTLDGERIELQLQALLKEELVQKTGNTYSL